MRSTQSLGYRLYKMSRPTGILCSLPLVLAVAWYAWSAFAQLDRYRRAGGEDVPWSLELFQIALHDELVRDLRRLTLPERPADSALPTFALSLTRDSFDALNEQLYSDAERTYVKGYVQKDGIVHPIRLRYRGSKPWHWLGVQKSMKLRLDAGDLIDGTRVFNLINDPTPLGLEDQIVLDLARQLGLLAPEYHPVRVRLNNSDLGTFRYAAQPVEGLLRRGRRMPGALYSGDTEQVDSTLHVGDLFFARHGWQQVAVQAGKEREDEAAFAPLDGLLAAVQEASFAAFASYADRTIDVERYAIFDALDVVFGGAEHDYFSNHKLYFDPYRGRFEPVAWSFRGFKHEPVFNRIDHPLLIRLKMTPEYLARRNRIIFGLLLDQASVPQVRARVDRLFAGMAADLETGPYWDAYKLLPRVTRFHRFMARPMSTAKWLLAARAELHGYNQRVRYLLDALERPGVTGMARSIASTQSRVDLVVDGHAAQRVRQVSVSGPCAGDYYWQADVNRNQQLDADDPVVAAGTLGTSSRLDGYADLSPGTRLVARSDPQPKRGTVRIELEPRTYTYHLTTPCPPHQVALVLANRTTGGSMRLALPAGVDSSAVSCAELPPASSAPVFAAGQRSPHVWDYPRAPSLEIVRLGPGVVRIPETRIFAEHQQVVIAAGTRLAMGPDASLIFRGRVTGLGTMAKPIIMAAEQTGRPFGGIAIQGPATKGSRLAHWRVEGGSRVGSLEIEYPSLINIHDTRDIAIEAARFTGAINADDVLRATYVRDIHLHELDIDQAPVDGVDLEFADGEIRGLRIVGAGDDCLDLMGVDLLIVDSILSGCANNALSVGEESQVSAQGLFISDSKTGVLAKNDSQARITRSLIYETATALKTKRRDIHYMGESRIGASDLFVVACERAVDEAPGSRIKAGQFRQSLPATGTLNHLAQNVLGLSGWDHLGMYMSHLRMGAQP